MHLRCYRHWPRNLRPATLCRSRRPAAGMFSLLVKPSWPLTRPANLFWCNYCASSCWQLQWLSHIYLTEQRLNPYGKCSQFNRHFYELTLMRSCAHGIMYLNRHLTSRLTASESKIQNLEVKRSEKWVEVVTPSVPTTCHNKWHWKHNEVTPPLRGALHVSSGRMQIAGHHKSGCCCHGGWIGHVCHGESHPIFTEPGRCALQIPSPSSPSLLHLSLSW